MYIYIYAHTHTGMHMVSQKYMHICVMSQTFRLVEYIKDCMYIYMSVIMIPTNSTNAPTHRYIFPEDKKGTKARLQVWFFCIILLHTFPCSHGAFITTYTSVFMCMHICVSELVLHVSGVSMLWENWGMHNRKSNDAQKHFLNRGFGRCWHTFSEQSNAEDFDLRLKNLCIHVCVVCVGGAHVCGEIQRCTNTFLKQRLRSVLTHLFWTIQRWGLHQNIYLVECLLA